MNFKKVTLAAMVGLLGSTVGLTAFSADGNWADYDKDNIPPADSVIGPHVHNGYFMGIYGGGTWLPDTDLNARVNSSSGAYLSSHEMTISSNTGYNGGLLFGYDYKLLRLEANVDAARADADTVQAAPGTFSNSSFNVNGSTTAYSAFANALLNVKTGPVNFFGGGGVGAVYVDYDYKGPNSLASVSESNGNAAFQAIAGLGYNFNDRVELDLMYRYIQTQSSSFKEKNDITGNTVTYSTTYSSNNLDLALRYFFV